MSLAARGTLFRDKLPIGNFETRILAVCYQNCRVADSDRLLATEIRRSEAFQRAIESGLEIFTGWLLSQATSHENISRASRKLEVAGTMRQSPEMAGARRQPSEVDRKCRKQK